MRLFYRIALVPLICLVAVLVGRGMASFFDPRIPSAEAWHPAPEPTTLAQPTARNTAAPLPPASPTPAAPPTLAAIGAASAAPTATTTVFFSAADPTPAPAVAEPTPTSLPPTIRLIRQVDEAVAALRAGEIDAELTYLDGTRTYATVHFDLGDDQRAPRFKITTTYVGTAGTQIVERITIGDLAWQREAHGAWLATEAHETPINQLEAFLPHLDPAAAAMAEEGLEVDALRWYDVRRDTDMTLSIDRATGAPRTLQQTARVSRSVLTVTYKGWNTQVEITPPEGFQ
jgi:hypothetical protein